MARVRVLEQYCKSCELCVSVCPRGVLAMPDTISRRGTRVVEVVAEDRCTACLRCTAMCPDAAIEIDAGAPASVGSP